MTFLERAQDAERKGSEQARRALARELPRQVVRYGLQVDQGMTRGGLFLEPSQHL